MQANPNRFLRKVGTNRILHWTRILAKRKDMVEMTSADAMTQISASVEQNRARIASIKDPEKRNIAIAKLAKIKALTDELNEFEKMTGQAEQEQKVEAEAAIMGEKPQLKPDDIDTSKKGDLDRAVAEEDRKSRILAEDKETQAILAMKTKQEVVDYLVANFGVKEDPKQALEKLRFVALEKRKERVFEV